ncbi:DUF3592 domain-containing protein [Erwinia sp. Eh17-17]|uniref:DUF3592 domain-containing protein n=1 Tax=Erwinia sp. Eh17-17 TaxID=3080330 RepID=UPI003208F9EB
MSKIKLVFRIMLVVGLFLAGLSSYLAYESYQFQSKAIQTQGKVTDLRFSRSDSSSSGVWYPEVTFVDNKGETIVFESSVGSSSYRNALGDEIGVLYLSEDPEAARIADNTSLYLSTIVLGGMSVVILFIGFIGSRVTGKGSRYAKLVHNGRPVEADIVGVELNEAIQFNGRSPWRIVCQWLDPSSNTIHVFNSDNFYYDPSPYLKDDKIRVYVDHGNVKKYYVDTSSFPKKA